MLYQFDENTVNNQPNILKYWLTNSISTATKEKEKVKKKPKVVSTNIKKIKK